MKNPKFSLPIFVIILLGFATSVALAAPHFGEEEFTYRQPDGETFQVRLYGDEFFAYVETVDGFLVIRDPNNGLFCYAKVKPDGSDIISTGVRVGQAKPAGLNPKQRLASGMAMTKSIGNRNLLGADEKGRRNHGKKLLKGKGGEILNVALADAPIQPAAGDEPPPENPPVVQPAPPPAVTINQRVGLVLLASFPDRPGDVTKSVANVDDYCNAESYTADGNATSVYGYFKIQSNGKLSYKNNVTAWFTAANPRSYYTDNTVGYGTRARDLIKEGLAVLKAQGFDFTQCDGNNDGKLDGVNIFYAGARTNAWSEGIWPHQSSSSWTGLTGTGLTSTSYDYQITDMPASLPIGTFCHENGHMICDFPDLYSYDGNAANLGNYSLMASSGSTHPRHVDPYLKIHAGWADVVDLTSASLQQCSVQQDRNFFYRYRNPARTTEYFIFEVRGTAGYEGVWNGAAATNPTNGLVIYHAMQTGSNPNSTIFTADAVKNYTKPYELMVVESTPSAVAPWYNDPTPGTNDAFSSTGVSAISDVTTPVNLNFWAADGRTLASGANIYTISAAGQTMTFIAGTGPLLATPATNVTATQFQPNVDFGENAANHTFSVFNNGGGTLSYTVSANAAWLSCAPTSGTATTEADLITVSYSTAALAAGNYAATITINGGTAGNKTIAVTLTVNPRPTLAAAPGSLSVAGITGTTGPTATFNLSNTGGGTVGYALTKTQAWLTLDRASGTVEGEQDLVTATFNATSLAPGVYTDTITVTAAEATNSPLTIPVTFTVDGTDMILTAPNGGESWYFNTTQAITWASSLGGTVKIELFKNGVLNSTVAASAPNTGSYSWSIPSSLTVGSDYKIKITSVESPTKTDQSFTNFTIAEDLLAAALDTTGLSWSTTSTTPWFSQTTTTHDTVDAAQSANITHSEVTTMETTIVGPGIMTFWWQVSSESGYDYLRFYLNGVEQTGSLAKISGNVAWVQKTVTIPAGSNVVKWGYDKDGSVDGGTLAGVTSDTAWVDQVVFTPDSQPEIAVEQPVGTNLTDGSASINFGSINTGSSSSLFTFTVKNTGTANLTGLAITKDGTNSSDYEIGALGSTTLAPAASTTFTVTFTPGAVGSRTAAIHIASNDADENPFDINLTGSGVGPGALSVAGAGGLASVGNYGGPFTPSSVQYTLSNPGNTAINWTTSKTANWVTLSSTAGTLAAGTSTTVTVSINSNANTLSAGDYNDTVTFTNTSNGSGNTTSAVALTVNTPPVVNAGSDQSVYLNGNSWSPISLGPQLWLDAADATSITLNGGTVSQWADKSSFNRHATQATTANQPTHTSAGLNGKAVVTFDGSNDFFATNLDFLASVSHSAFIVTKPTVYSNIYGAATGSAGANSLHVGFASSTTYRINYWGNDFGPALSANFVAGSANIMNFVWTTGTGKQIMANGKSEGTNTSAGTIGTMSGGGRIGHTTTGSHTAFGGDIAEFIILTGAVSAADRQKLEGFLAHKWGLTGRLDAAHPYKSSGPNSAVAIANLDGTASDANGHSLTTQWTVVSGPASVSFGSVGSIDTAATFTAAGVYTLRLTANDGYSQVSDDVVITVNPAGVGYSLTYAGNGSTGGSAPVDASSPYGNGATVTVLGNTGSLLRTGYTFNGWNTAADGSGTNYTSGNTFTISSATTLYAQWTPNSYTVTFDKQSGSGGSNNVNATFGAAMPSATAPTRTGYTFGGYYTQVSGGGTQYYTSAMVSSRAWDITTNTTLYAYWVPNSYTITFDKQSGSGGSNTVSATFGAAMPSATAPTRTGFTFGGYYTQVSGGGTQYYTTAMASTRAWDITTNTTLYAQWTPNTYTVVFDKQSGVSGSTSVSATYGSAMPAATAPTRSGYTFGGYYTAAGGAGNQYYTASMVSSRNWDLTSATTLYAKWNLPPEVNAGSDQTVEMSAVAPWTPGISYHPISNDADSGISSSKTYTHALDFGSDTSRALINGVQFQAGAATFGTISGTSATIGTGSTNIATTHAGDSSAAPYLNGSSACAMEGLVKDMYYNAPNGVITLTGLTPGKHYQFRLYNRVWGAVAGTIRGQNIGFDTNGVGIDISGSEYTATFNEDDARNPGPSFSTFSQVYALTLDYVLSPGVTTLKVYINKTSTGTYHLYGLTNEEVPGSAGTANLAGTASDPDAQSITTAWTVVSAPAGGATTFVDPTALNTAVNFYAYGTYVMRLTASDGIDTTSDDIVVTAVGPVDHFAISSISTPQTVGTPINGITITAQDAINQTVIGFNGTVSFGGTAGVSDISANFVSGVLTGVSVTPMQAGNNLTLTVNDGVGHTGSATFSVKSLFEKWGSNSFANPFTDTATTDNPDGDSLTNLQEFAFAMDPTSSTLSSLAFNEGGEVTQAGIPVLRYASSKYHAVFARRKDYVAAGLTYSAEFSADLKAWTPSADGLSVLTGAGSSELEAVSIEFPTTVPVDGSVTPQSPKFFRVGVQ